MIGLQQIELPCVGVEATMPSIGAAESEARLAMARARASDDPDKRRVLRAAEAHLQNVFDVFNRRSQAHLPE